MDDLRTDLQNYFESTVRVVEFSDIVDESSYVVAALPDTSNGRRSLSRLQGAGVGALLVLLVWSLIALTGGGFRPVGDTTSPAGITAPATDSTVPEPSRVDTPHTLDFTYTSPGRRWEPWGGFRLQKSAEGPQGAEGLVYWLTYPTTDHATNCLIGGPEFSRVGLDSLARGVTDAPGLTLVSGPHAVLVGGHRALYSELEIKADDGCDPGYFYNWRADDMGAMWLTYSVGDVVDIWFVDVSSQGQIMVIVGLTNPEFPILRDEIQEFVSSIVFATE